MSGDVWLASLGDGCGDWLGDEMSGDVWLASLGDGCGDRLPLLAP